MAGWKPALRRGRRGPCLQIPLAPGQTGMLSGMKGPHRKGAAPHQWKTSRPSRVPVPGSSTGLQSERIPQFHTHETRRLNRYRQALVEGWAAEIAFLESVGGIGRVEKVGRYC